MGCASQITDEVYLKHEIGFVSHLRTPFGVLCVVLYSQFRCTPRKSIKSRVFDYLRRFYVQPK